MKPFKLEMKPFNLERALAGDPVITRDGRQVTEIHYFKTVRPTYCPLVAVIDGIIRDGIIRAYRTDGTFSCDGDSDFDLFMAPIKRDGWLIKRKDSPSALVTTAIFSTEKEARLHLSSAQYQFIKIEWEE